MEGVGMRTRVLYLVLPCLLVTGCHSPAAQTEPGQKASLPPAQQEEAPEGSFSAALRPVRTDNSLFLFNGSNLDGWSIVGNPGDWSIQEGVLRSQNGEDGGWLRFNEALGDFVLKLDWKVSKNGNSGVFIRAAEEGDPSGTGHLIAISSQSADDLHFTCSLSGQVGPDPKPDTSAHSWHTFEILSQGSRIAVSSDGVQCLDVDQASIASIRDKPLQGYIGLQSSQAGEGRSIEFRNVRLKLLEP